MAQLGVCSRVFTRYLTFMTLITVTLCQSDAPSITDNMLAVVQDRYCDSTDVSANYLFIGGADYFEPKFERMISVIKMQSSSLESLRIAESTVAPSTEVINAVNAIKASGSPRTIESVTVILGVLSDPLYCYTSNGRQVPCSDHHAALFTTTKDIWSYRYDCDGWKAIFSTAKVKFTSGTLIK